MTSEQHRKADGDLDQLEASLRNRKQHYEANPNDQQAALDLCDSFERLGLGYLKRKEEGDADRAEESLSQSVLLRRKIADASVDETQSELDLVYALQELAKATGAIEGYVAAAMAFEIEYGAWDIAMQLHEQNPESFSIGRTVALAFRMLSRRALAADEMQHVTLALSGSYMTLQSLLEAGHELDAELLALYEELTEMLNDDDPSDDE